MRKPLATDDARPSHPIPARPAAARTLRRLVAAGCAAISLMACDTVAEGKNDLLAFSFDADTQLIPAAFSTPIAKGMTAGVLVLDAANNKTAVPVINAESNNTAVVEVVSTTGNLITLEGRSAGTAEIFVVTAAGEDAFDVTVAEIGKVDLDYPGAIAADSPKSKGVQGGTASFLMSLKDASGKVLIGAGPVPAEVGPAGAATLAANQSAGHLLLRFELPGTLEVTGLGDEKLTMDVVPSADLTALNWKGFDAVPSLPVGAETVGILRGVLASGDKVVGVASLATTLTNDATICTITPNPRLGEGVFTVATKKAGDCQISASLGALAARATITVTP